MNMDIRPCRRKRTTAVQEEEESSESSLSLLSNIIDEVLIEILIKLRCSKFVNRCKLVCKRWNSIISSPFFIHKFNSEADPNPFTLVFQWLIWLPETLSDIKCPILSISTLPMMFRTQTNDTVLRHINLDFLQIQLNSPQISSRDPSLLVEAICHDLLLLSQYDTQYYVVNPVTRQWRALPPPPPSCNRGGNFFCAGLLCDYDCNSYSFRFKVIRVPIISTVEIEMEEICPFSGRGNPASYRLDSSEFSIHIFCSVSKQWTEYIVNWYPFRLTHYLDYNPFVSHNGMLHWLNGRSLVSFNPFAIDVDDVDRVLLNRTIELPEDLPHDLLVLGADALALLGTKVNLLGFGVTGAHLRVITEHGVERSHSVCVWELEERENKAFMWHLAHKVLVSDLPLKERVRNCRLEFLAFHPHDTDVLFFKIVQFIYQINLRTETSKRFQPLKHRYTDCELIIAVPALQHQLFPTPLTSPSPDSPVASAVCIQPL